MKLPPLGDILRATSLPRSTDATRLVERTLKRALGAAGLTAPIVSTKLAAGPLTAWQPPGRASMPSAPDAGSDARFLTCHLDTPGGPRSYRLYVPMAWHGQSLPLVVMLHGCTQTPEDFAIGTGMNRAAEAAGCLVAYPEQIAAANASRCWNWFNRADQVRGQGEPALIAAIIGEIIRSHAVDRRRIYVAGLSAGGAAAAVMGATYPDLFAAIGVHSGLACGAAHNAASAFAAMRDGAAAPVQASRVPAIVFHGDRDGTVNPRNADAIVAQFAPDADLIRREHDGRAAGGRSWHKTTLTNASGQDVLEQWTVQGLGHAWSGGDAAGSYTEPTGPDATREMLRFFLAHTKPAA